MGTYWWIARPRLRASSNPGDADLARLRAQGFKVLVSLLDESEEPPNYSRSSAERSGWSCHRIPVRQNGAPRREDLERFMALVDALPKGARLLVHCQSGLGRSSCMAAAYLVARGMALEAALSRVVKSCKDRGWITPARKNLLRRWQRLATRELSSPCLRSPATPPRRGTPRRRSR